jgi:hypothetical protein
MVLLRVTAGTYTTPIAIYQELNQPSSFVQGDLATNYNSFSAYLSTFILTATAWDSSISYSVTFQLRIKEAPNSYRILLSPTSSNVTNPITTILPLITYEKTLYIDIVDTENNFLV